MREEFYIKAYKENTVGSYYHNNVKSENALTKSLYIYNCGMHLVIEPQYSIERPDGRSDYQIIYVVNGCGHFFIDGKEHIAQKGDFVLYRPGEPQFYKYYTKENTRVYYLHFGGYSVPDILKSCNINENCNIYHIGLTKEIEDEFQSIIHTMILKDNFCELETNAYLYMLFTKIAKQKMLVERSNNPITGYEKIEPAIDFLRKNFELETPIETLAKLCSLSSSRFTHIFTACMNMPPSTYKHQLRIDHAKLLLNQTNLSIKEIAYITGYNDSMYFSKYFKKLTGVTPSQFRK